MLTPEQRESLRLKIQAQYKPEIKKRAIRAIKVNSASHWQPPLYIEVGQKVAHLEPDGRPELVIAIFESGAFMVVTPEHGHEKGLPHFFAKEDVQQVVEF